MIRPALMASVTAAMFASAFATAASAQTTLRYKFTDGETASYVTTTKTESTVPVGGMTMKTVANQTIVSNRTVKDVADDGTAQVSDLTESLKMETQITGGPQPITMQWDSTSGEEPAGQLAMAAPVLTALVGSETTYTMSPAGEVSDPEYSEKLKQAIQTLPNGQQLMDQFAANSITLPDGPVNVGDSWPFEMASGQTKMTGKQTLKSLDGDIAVIEGDVTVEIDGEMMPGMKMKVTDSSGKLTTRFNVAGGHIEKQTIEMNMKMDIDFGGQSMSNESQSSTTIVRQDG